MHLHWHQKKKELTCNIEIGQKSAILKRDIPNLEQNFSHLHRHIWCTDLTVYGKGSAADYWPAFIEYSAHTRDFDYNRSKGMKNTTDGYWAQARLMPSLRIRRVSCQPMDLLGQSSQWQVPVNGESTLSAADTNITKWTCKRKFNRLKHQLRTNNI
jgi:hypothetical protein